MTHCVWIWMWKMQWQLITLKHRPCSCNSFLFVLPKQLNLLSLIFCVFHMVNFGENILKKNRGYFNAIVHFSSIYKPSDLIFSSRSSRNFYQHTYSIAILRFLIGLQMRKKYSINWATFWSKRKFSVNEMMI